MVSADHGVEARTNTNHCSRFLISRALVLVYDAVQFAAVATAFRSFRDSPHNSTYGLSSSIIF